MKKRIFTVLLTVAMLVSQGVTVSPAAAAVSYDGEKAVEYAAGHWNDGKGYCAEFASDCIKRAGLSSWSTSSTKLFHQLCKEVVADAQIATVQRLTVTDRKISLADNRGKVAKGDIVFFQCDHCAHCMHTLIVSDVSGENAKCYQHNPRVNNKDIKIDPCYQCKREYSNIIAIHFGTDPTEGLLDGVLAAPPGGGRVLAKPAAISCLDGISYSGDRSAITMTQPQAQAIADRLAACDAEASGAVCAALFDAGAGVPGLFVATGYGPAADGAFDRGEAALWSFQDGSLVPFAPVQGEKNTVTLFPAHVYVNTPASKGAPRTEWYYAMGHGRLYPVHACALTTVSGEGYQLYGANGRGVTGRRYQELTAAYQGSGGTASAGPGGAGYRMENMTPAAQVIAALEDYMTALVTPIAYPSTQSVEIDGKKVELSCYALKDERRNDTNYIRVRDLADALNGTAAQFAVDWAEGEVTLTTRTAYLPNGTEGVTPYAGNRVYETVEAATRIDGQPVELDAFWLRDDSGGAYTYYKLRDLGKTLGFNVGWSGDKGVFLETDKPYDPNN